MTEAPAAHGQAPLRVLHLLGELRPSGAETMLVSAAPAFRTAGVQATVLATGATPGPFAQQMAKAGYDVRHLPFQRGAMFFWQLARLLRACRCDVVHLHTESANFWKALVARALPGVGVLRTVHSNFPFEGRLARVRGWQRRTLARLGVQHVSISPSVHDNELSRFGLPSQLIPNWYDSQRFRPPTFEERGTARTALRVPHGTRLVVTVGNCAPVKNHENLLRALALLPNGTEDVLYCHAGQEQHDEPERALALQLGVQQRVRFLGPQRDVLPLLHAADAFVMPSRFEGMSIAALEALACGVPCVMSHVPGLRDFEADFPQVIYTDIDAASIRDGLLRALALDAGQRDQLAAAQAARARQLHAIDVGVAAYTAAYRQLTRRHGTPLNRHPSHA